MTTAAKASGWRGWRRVAEGPTRDDVLSELLAAAAADPAKHEDLLILESGRHPNDPAATRLSNCVRPRPGVVALTGMSGSGEGGIRTDRGFAEKAALFQTGGADSSATPNSDPDLARLLDAWPTLPEPIRRAILALVESTVTG
jgi:hypothetical protein